jgi:hypothetical protein
MPSDYKSALPDMITKDAVASSSEPSSELPRVMPPAFVAPATAVEAIERAAFHAHLTPEFHREQRALAAANPGFVDGVWRFSLATLTPTQYASRDFLEWLHSERLLNLRRRCARCPRTMALQADSTRPDRLEAFALRCVVCRTRGHVRGGSFFDQFRRVPIPLILCALRSLSGVGNSERIDATAAELQCAPAIVSVLRLAMKPLLMPFIEAHPGLDARVREELVANPNFADEAVKERIALEHLFKAGFTFHDLLRRLE